MTDWPVLASKPGAKKADPKLHYRGRSFTGRFTLQLPTDDGEPPVGSNESMRCLVVHSDALADRFDKSLDDRLGREAKALAKTHRGVLAKEFACAADVEAAMGPLMKRLRWHTATVSVEQKEIVEKRTRRGRPPKDAPLPPSRTVFVPAVTLERDEGRHRRGPSAGVVLRPRDRLGRRRVERRARAGRVPSPVDG